MRPPLPHPHIDFHVRDLLEYGEFLKLQESIQERVFSRPQEQHLIICRHPLTLTRGRGDRQNQSPEGVPPPHLPLVEIHRGGGLTIHGPHQVILYPILKLSPSFGLVDYLEWLQQLTIGMVHRYAGINLEGKRCPLGLWHGGKKYASIGIGLKHFVTGHGLALNVEIPPFLPGLSPCGLAQETYSGLEAINPAVGARDFLDFLCRELC